MSLPASNRNHPIGGDLRLAAKRLGLLLLPVLALLECSPSPGRANPVDICME
jgi:hypothetical protein